MPIQFAAVCFPQQYVHMSNSPLLMPCGLSSFPFVRPQVETQLRQVNAHFARLNGMSGAHVLDLYGRTTANRLGPVAAQPAQSRKASKRLPLREATRQLIRQAHSKLPQGSSVGGGGTPPPGSPPGNRSSADGGSLPPSQTVSFNASRAPSSATAFGITPPAAAAGELSAAVSRQATVRFDVGPGEGQAPAVRRISSASATSAGGRGGGRGASGVLHIPDEREERLQPYRRLVIRTGSEPSMERPALAAASEVAGAPDGGGGFLMRRQTSAGEIHVDVATDEVEGGGSGPAAVLGSRPAPAALDQEPQHTTLRVSASGRDWGHITPSGEGLV